MGTFRSGRYPTNQPAPVDPDDKPEKPDGLDQEAASCWDRLVTPAVHLRRDDAPMCAAMCESWSLYRKAYALANDDPIDKNIRVAVVNYGTQFRSLAVTLSLDPLGRLRMAAKGGTRKNEINPLAEFGRVVGSPNDE